MRGILLLVACLLALLETAQAGSQSCSVEQATNQVQIDDMLRRGKVAQVTIPLLTELQTIAGKAPDPHRPLAEQLDSHAVARFAEIGQQLKQMKLSAYVESAHARDANVVQQMIAAAWKSYADPAYVPEAGDVPAAAVMLMRLTLKNQTPWSPPMGTGCSVDAAIAHQQQANFARINAITPMLNRDVSVIQRLRAHYGVGQDDTLDPEKMDPDDARMLRTIQVEMQPAFREQTILLDLQHIRAWWVISDLVYRTRTEDVATYASVDHLGDTLQPQLNAMSQEQQFLLGVWKKIEERVRSEEQKQLEQTSKALQAVQNRH